MQCIERNAKAQCLFSIVLVTYILRKRWITRSLTLDNKTEIEIKTGEARGRRPYVMLFSLTSPLSLLFIIWGIIWPGYYFFVSWSIAPIQFIPIPRPPPPHPPVQQTQTVAGWSASAAALLRAPAPAPSTVMWIMMRRGGCVAVTATSGIQVVQLQTQHSQQVVTLGHHTDCCRSV